MAKLNNETTAKQLNNVIDYLTANYKAPRASGITAWALLASASKPSTHAEQQAQAKVIVEKLGFDITSSFNSGSCWHSAPRKSARKLTGNLARYSSETIKTFGNLVWACTQHGLYTEKCNNTCLQGLYGYSLIDNGNSKNKADYVIGKSLFELANKTTVKGLHVANSETKKAKKGKEAKPKNKATKANNEVIEPNSDESMAIAEQIKNEINSEV